jgi:3-methyl-2-oxobutanoate hydroxymethyltransferase
MKKMTLPKLRSLKGKRKISMVTCYDYTFARLVEKAEIDTILVGDSLGMVVAGDSTTLKVEPEMVEYHLRCVRKGAQSPFLIADMPFGSYQSSIEEGSRRAIEFIKAGAEAVKIEGGAEVVPLVERLSSFGIPVVGHVGLTPQYVNKFGGFGKRGKSERDRDFILESALLVEKAGADMMVLESIPENLAKTITEELSIPTIGIGAGPACDGQVLVLYDLLGMDDSFYPGFVKRYLNLDGEITDALKQYKKEVSEGIFPEKPV